MRNVKRRWRSLVAVNLPSSEIVSLACCVCPVTTSRPASISESFNLMRASADRSSPPVSPHTHANAIDATRISIPPDFSPTRPSEWRDGRKCGRQQVRCCQHCAPTRPPQPSPDSHADDVEFATNYGLIQPEESRLVKGWFIAEGRD